MCDARSVWNEPELLIGEVRDNVICNALEKVFLRTFGTELSKDI